MPEPAMGVAGNDLTQGVRHLERGAHRDCLVGREVVCKIQRICASSPIGSLSAS